jgi:putative membrane protein
MARAATVRGSLAAGLVGLALAVVALLPLQRQASLGTALTASLWPLLVVSPARAVTLALHTLGWRALLSGQPRLRFWPLLRFRWIGEAINALLPAMQVGGDLARARLVVIGAGVSPGAAGAALVLDLTAGAASQAVIVLLGVALLLAQGGTHTLPVGPAVLGIAAVLAAVVGLLAAVRFGRRPLRAMVNRLAARTATIGEAGSQPELESNLRSQLARRGSLARSFAWHLLGWLSQVAETWLILQLLGVPVAAGTALVIESLTGAARAAAFFLPGGLGVQEGTLGYLALAGGVPAEAAVTLVIVKRLREVVVGLPALMVWAFHERALLDWLFRRSDSPPREGGSP